MSFDFLADDNINIPDHNWQFKAHYIKREALGIENIDDFIKHYGKPKKDTQLAKLKKDIEKNPLAYLRTLFLRDEFMLPLNENKQAQIKPSYVGNGWDLLQASLEKQAPEYLVKNLPKGSAYLTLKFKLLSPLLTADDEPFYLFDNPLRKDHIFSVPYLSAAALKGLSSDAYCRGFSGNTEWTARGQDNTERLLNLYSEDQHARRLFGLTNDEQDIACKGRLHFSPIWFNWVQYIVLNKMNQDKGIGTQPLHFEAVSPIDDKDKQVTYSFSVFYFNPVGIDNSSEQIVREDLARWLATVASWWPVLGLGAKRLAGYGAIEPISIDIATNDWKDTEVTVSKAGKNSWSTMAQWIAGE